MIETIFSADAPAAIGPYSQAIKTGDLVFCSGHLGILPETKKLAQGIEAQTLQVFRNIRAVLAAAGCTLNNVVKTTVFLTDMKDFPTVNTLYGNEFGAHKPARSTVQVARLPLDALVEIECIAAIP
jgi:2-iminobutanoate/2-iminopropanoate deaminase